MLFPDFLPKLGDNCVRNLVCVPYLCSSRLSGGLSGKNVLIQSSCELEEREGFASLPRVRITPCPLQRVPICVFMSTYVPIGLYFDWIRIYNPFMTRYVSTRIALFCVGVSVSRNSKPSILSGVPLPLKIKDPSSS